MMYMSLYTAERSFYIQSYFSHPSEGAVIDLFSSTSNSKIRNLVVYIYTMQAIYTMRIIPLFDSFKQVYTVCVFFFSIMHLYYIAHGPDAFKGWLCWICLVMYICFLYFAHWNMWNNINHWHKNTQLELFLTLLSCNYNTTISITTNISITWTLPMMSPALTSWSIDFAETAKLGGWLVFSLGLLMFRLVDSYTQ